MHAYYLKTWCENSANTRIFNTKKDHGHSTSNLARKASNAMAFRTRWRSRRRASRSTPRTRWRSRRRRARWRSQKKQSFRGLTVVKPLQPACHAAPGPLSRACLSAAHRLLWDDATLILVTALADPCGSTTQRAVRLDDTMTATPTLPSVGPRAPFPSRSANWDMPPARAPTRAQGLRWGRTTLRRSYTRPHGPGRKRVWEIHTLRARATNMRWCVIHELTISLYTFLNYYDRQIFHRLHWTNQWLCVSRRTNINDLKPGTNYQSTTLCTIRQYLIDLAGLVWNSNLLLIISGLAS